MNRSERPSSEATLRFKATLASAPDLAPAAALLPVPAGALAESSVNASDMIEGTAAGFPFRAPFDGEARGLRISAALLEALGAEPGDTVNVEITRVGEAREVKVPADLTAALAASPKANALWHEITPMARREWVRWIASAKQEKTREKRIEVGIDKLLHGMRRPCCFPGLNWVTKDLVFPEETWGPLPGGKAPAKQ